jgi:hypothetical protein
MWEYIWLSEEGVNEIQDYEARESWTRATVQGEEATNRGLGNVKTLILMSISERDL